jgi:hypothetical protein
VRDLIYGRRWRLQVGDFVTEEHDLRFRVERTPGLDVNIGQIDVYNLDASERARLASFAVVLSPDVEQVSLSAGYPDLFGAIFTGDIVRVTSAEDDTDVVTRIEAGDAEAALRQSITIASFEPGASVGDVMAQVVRDLGVAGERVVERVKAGDYPGAFKAFERGVAAAGRSSDLARKLEQATGLTLSVQSGELVGLADDETTTDPVIVLDPKSGLIGSPWRADGGILMARAALLPGIFPHRAIRIEGVENAGSYKALRCLYEGDTAGDDWHVDMELRPL